MARKKSAPTRMDKRREADAVEARDREEPAAEEEVAEPEEDADEGGDDDEEGGTKAKKKPAKAKKPAAAKKAPSKRTRTPKEVRTKAVWVVFDNASKRVETFPYSQKKDAEELLAKKIEEKKTTFYLNLIKDPFE